ncbi:MAG TPA: pyruvate ferredoxin oxidoreductase, partial [bacterium]|nr:pyruvate ferredoxin oxidoreductase [bacterium]
SWQPLPVRTGTDKEVQAEEIANEAKSRNIKNLRVYIEDLPDARMQNITLLANILKNKVIPGLELDHCEKAMKELMSEKVFVKNIEMLSK